MVWDAITRHHVIDECVISKTIYKKYQPNNLLLHVDLQRDVHTEPDFSGYVTTAVNCHADEYGQMFASSEMFT